MEPGRGGPGRAGPGRASLGGAGLEGGALTASVLPLSWKVFRSQCLQVPEKETRTAQVKPLDRHPVLFCNLRQTFVGLFLRHSLLLCSPSWRLIARNRLA